MSIFGDINYSSGGWTHYTAATTASTNYYIAPMQAQMAPAQPRKPPTDREWLDAEIAGVCALAP